MPLTLIYLVRNLTRNPLRTALTCAAVGLPIMIFVLSAATVDGIERFLNNAGKQLRLAITHKAGVVNNLPFGHRRRIEALDPERVSIRSVCSVLWIGGRVPGVKMPLSTLAGDADTFIATFPDYRLTDDQVRKWNSDKQSLLVGPGTARQLGWNEGDRVTITPSIPPYEPLEFHVLVPPPDVPDPTTNWFRRDYWEDYVVGKSAIPGWINFFFVKCGSLRDIDVYRGKIDALFAGTPDETKSLDEKTFMNQFISQQFNLPRNVRILAGVTVLVAILAAANTMSMNFRDRIGEYASLKSMGFGGRTIFGLVQGEALLICGLAGLIGVLVPYIAFTYSPLRNVTLPLIQTLDVRPEVCMMGVGIALLIGFLAGLWPSWLTLRLRVVTALRNLE